MSTILYYSNFCQHSKSLIQHVSKNPELTKDIHFICIDKRIKTPDNKTKIVLENGQQIAMPDNLNMVPALLLLNDNYRIIYGEEIMSHFKPRQEVVTRVATNNNMEPEAFAIGGGGYGSLSDAYSFLDMNSDDLSAKGDGGTRQMHHFVGLEHSDKINTPQDDTDYKGPKIPESTLEKLMQEREKDIQTGPQQQQFH